MSDENEFDSTQQLDTLKTKEFSIRCDYCGVEHKIKLTPLPCGVIEIKSNATCTVLYLIQ